MENRQGKRDSEQAGISAPDIPQPKEQKSSDRTHVGVASFVVQDNSRVVQSHTDSKFIAIDSSSHRPQSLLDATDGVCNRDSEQAETSTNVASSQPMCKSGDYTQVGSTLALGQKGGTVHQRFHDTTIFVGTLPYALLNADKPCDQVAAALSLTESKVTRKSKRSTLHIEDMPPNQDSISSRSEEIEKLFRKVIGEWNSVLCIQDNLISRIEKLLPKDSREIFSIMVEILNYFLRNKKSLEIEYRRERALSFKHDLHKSFRPVLYDKLKKLILETSPKHLAIAGPAGAGKSTLLKRIVRDLSSDERYLLSEKLIVFLNFRDLYSEKEITPYELLFHGLFNTQSQRDMSYEWLLQNQEKVIFLLDGLDQARFTVSSKAKLLRDHSEGSASDIISNILSRRLFPKSKIVYSSREHSVSSLEDTLRPDKVISLTGFSHEDAEYLFTNAICDGQDLWRKMETSLKALVAIPVFLTFTILVYMYNPDSPPTSMTEIMQKLFESFIRSENVLNRDASGKIPIATLKGLQKLSFTGLCDKRLSFNSENFHDVGLNLQDVRDFVIIVPGIALPTFCVFEGDYVIFFTHQSIQEFFAAQYIVQLDLKSFRETVGNHLRKDDWSVVTRFVSGILLNKKSQIANSNFSNLTEKQEILRGMLMSNYDEGCAGGRDVASILSTLASIAEAEDRDFIQSAVKNISLHDRPIGVSGILSIASILCHCSHLQSLDIENCRLNADEARFWWENVLRSGVKINKLNVAMNELGNGFQYICKIIAHCGVRELRVSKCLLQSSHVSCLKDIRPSQLHLLDLYENDVSEVVFSDIGVVIDDGGKLFLSPISGIIAAGVLLLEKALGAKRLQGLHIGIGDVNHYRSSPIRPLQRLFKTPDTFFTSVGNIIADGGSLSLRSIGATPCGWQRLKLALGKKKISRLDLSQNNLDARCCEVIGKIVSCCSVSELSLEECTITEDGLNHFFSAAKEAKIRSLNLYYNKFNCSCYLVIGNIVKCCSVDELSLANCKITLDALDHFLSAAKGAKISSLNLSFQNFDAFCCEIIGNIVRCCSIDELLLKVCEITDDALDHFLSAAKGAKLTKLELRGNHLSQAAIERIGESITVKNLGTLEQSRAAV